MNSELFRSWLTQTGKKSNLERFVYHATERRENSCLKWAIEETGLCPEDATLLDLSVGQLYALWARRSSLLPSNRATYLKAILQFAAAQDPSANAPSGPLTLQLLAGELQACFNDPKLPALLMSALLLEEPFYFSNAAQRRELCHGTNEYTVCRGAILEHLSKLPEQVCHRLARDIHPIIAASCAGLFHTELLCLRRGYSQLALRLEKALSGLPGYSGSAEEDLILRMKGWNPNFSTDHKQDDTALDWYRHLTEDQMTQHICRTILKLTELALTHRNGQFSPPLPITDMDQTDQLYYALLAPFDRLITLKLEKSAALSTPQIGRLLSLGLLRVERVPKAGTSCLCLSPTAVRTLSDDPEVRPDLPGSLEGIWMDQALVTLLDSLLTDLEKQYGAAQLGVQFLRRAPELIALLAAAPRETASSLPPQASELSGVLGQLLKGADDLPALTSSTRQELTALLQQFQTQEQAVETSARLAYLLVRCHWTAIEAGPSNESIQSLQRLIDLYRLRPASTTQALTQLLHSKNPDGHDWAMRCTRVSGDSLLLAELYRLSALHALELAGQDDRPLHIRLALCGRARSDARTGREMAARRGDYLLALELHQFQLKALCRLALLSADSGSTGAELFSDCISPCAEAVLSGRKLLQQAAKEEHLPPSAQDRANYGQLLEQRRQEFEAFLPTLHRRLFSPCVVNVLRSTHDLWQAITDCSTAPDPWQALARLHLHVPADDAEPVPPPSVPTVWLPAPRKAQVFRPYYCSYLDSETTRRKQYQPARIEAYLLKTILSMEDVVLTANQAIDNTILRTLVYQPAFRHILRTGHITVSFFHTFYSLRQYAAAKLADPGFLWSSLPEFNAYDAATRKQASEYLLGRCSAAQLPKYVRESLVRFGEEITLLDENLPARCKAYAYQHPGSGRGSGVLADKLDEFYLPRQGDPLLTDLCRLHFLLLSPSATEKSRRSLTRSQYQACLDALKTGKLDFLSQMDGLCDPALFHNTHQRQILESYLQQDKQPTLALMQSVLSDRHNEMLGRLCTDYQHHIYSEAERIILPYHDADPINEGGCRLFQDTVSVTETGVRFGWEQVPEFLLHSEAILSQTPGISPDDLAGKLAGNQLDYTISNDGGALWLARGTIRTSQNQTLLVEQRPNTGTIHLQTEGV